ncbi:hypothetical protein D9758_016596 [Tetrapyrgos nigripes]|uniref:Uncharacterized protein n=1 Tax=Tetrapyrgos nigripes TaxID=182062 RepID=A0A8H5FLL2_9AGAR|nr:hypothetical protein D9758_016596 [Tetrapyrgos nigripes]
MAVGSGSGDWGWCIGVDVCAVTVSSTPRPQDQSEESEEQGWALREFEPGNGISLPLSDTPWKQWAMGPGFLIVYSEPGKEGSLNKFQDLYNWHKHVSLPLHHLKSFLSAVLVKKQEILDRRTSEGHTDLDESSLSSSLKSGNPAKYLVTHGITWGGDGESEKAAREWAETSVTELKKTEGWVTTRTFRVIAWLS